MENLSEKTKEILNAAGIKDIECLRGADADELYVCLYFRTFDNFHINRFHIEKAAEEIAEALKQKEH
jgi:hypothetical protein